MYNREKRFKTNGQSLRNLWENVKRFNIQVIRAPERRTRMRQEYIFKALIG